MARRRRQPGGLSANLTPMIDVVFLLIIFFVLVSQLARAERVELTLPQLLNPAAGVDDDDREVVVSILPLNHPDAGEYWCQVGVQKIRSGRLAVSRLADALADVLRDSPEANFTIRAPRDMAYERVYPALEACREAGVPEAQLAVESRDG
jgi:biopolymer transport protein ExbD